MKLLDSTQATKKFDLYEYINNFYDIKRNIYTNQIIIRRRSDNQQINKYDLLLELDKAGINTSMKKIDYLLKSSMIEEFSPYAEIIKELPEWTPKDVSHLRNLANYIHTDDKTRFINILYKWTINSLLQILGKGLNDVMLVFVSNQKQGIGKTALVRSLLSFMEYIQTGQSLLKNIENLPEASAFYPFIFYDEMKGLKKDSELMLFKTIISADTIEYRKFQNIYRKQRIANFIGTADNSELLFDVSGSRRFAIIEIDSIDFKYSSKIDFNKIWAEAYFYVKNNAYDKLIWTQKDFKEFEEYNIKYYKTSSIEFWIQKYLEPGTPENAQLLTSTEILILLSDLGVNTSIISNTDVRSIGLALQKLGFKRVITRRDGKKGRYYLVKIRKKS